VGLSIFALRGFAVIGTEAEGTLFGRQRIGVISAGAIIRRAARAAAGAAVRRATRTSAGAIVRNAARAPFGTAAFVSAAIGLRLLGVTGHKTDTNKSHASANESY
jgi:hypothetical protein